MLQCTDVAQFTFFFTCGRGLLWHLPGNGAGIFYGYMVVGYPDSLYVWGLGGVIVCMVFCALAPKVEHTRMRGGGVRYRGSMGSF